VEHSGGIRDLQSLSRVLGGEVSGGQVLAPGPGHSRTDRSMSVKLDATAPDGLLVHSFAGDDPIKCRDYVRERAGLPAFKSNGRRRRASTAEISNMLAAAMQSIESEPAKGNIVATYDYTDDKGELLYQVVRLEPKSFRQRRPDSKGGWIWKLADVRRVLYRWPELLKFPDATVFICEGEKDTDRVASLGHCATTISGGTQWTDVDVSILADRDVLVLEHADIAGVEKAHAAAVALKPIAKSIRVVRLPGHEHTAEKEGKDASDWLDADPRHAEKLVDICFDAPLWTPEAVSTLAPKTETKTEVKLTFFDQLTDAAPKPWLIKNVIARGETSSWIAQPGKGKSALLTDIAIHVAAGKDWRGFRTKGRSGVVIFALERADLLRRRLIAHRRRDDLPILPIAVVGQVIDLMHKSCVDLILGAIQQAEQHFGCEVGLVIIDTYPKGIAAGGGDESLAKDQNIVLANLRRVLDQVNIHIAGIGHTGKDESKGERGSNARLADVDLLVHVSGDVIKTAVVNKANDQPEGALTSFRLEPFDFGPDEDGDPFRTFILSDEIITGVAADRPLSDRQRLALEALSETALSCGRDAPLDYQLPHGIKVVAADEWKAELFRRKVLDEDAKNPRARFNELRTALAAKKVIGVRDEMVWYASKTP
jgi:AAA domain